ncbi:50S ribosomal protein L11 methyltransferase [Pseudochryseolinea flava]|uniref:Ribosomal protein L11 methyltransferase n=1 Tax=Pseudochryseolinea flava TaxID=2059302 RepID=A0A364Y8H8_9BACT|nr:50S ribosomal protein L11 methyltransferase [Pseudochryseolinea flava]RAW03213.1 50S ribosomal protein L11 methyltransferase [Pseudochryseolinea flava]
MYYTRLQVLCDPAFSEILIAEIAEAGFDSFMETDNGFEAFVEGDRFDQSILNDIQERYREQTTFSFVFDKIEKRNWNEEWEKSYEAINVENQCLIRAEFHQPNPNIPYEIVITPKMSFGTGHHQTTYLMIKQQMGIDHQGKRVMDAGCGTAILSIMASKLGASFVEAFDIDEWSVINGKENMEVNKTSNINLQQGKISEVQLEGQFDIILANINKNVLLAEIQTYQTYLPSNGLLLLSGFYTHDIEDLKAEASKFNLNEVRRDDRETWASLLLRKG